MAWSLVAGQKAFQVEVHDLSAVIVVSLRVQGQAGAPHPSLLLWSLADDLEISA